jgi:hypothetical protein
MIERMPADMGASVVPLMKKYLNTLRCNHLRHLTRARVMPDRPPRSGFLQAPQQKSRPQRRCAWRESATAG